MTSQIVHRGPDDQGIFVDPQFGIAFGFRRLSIIDLSPAGHQPMESTSGRYRIMMNGEIYNFAQLKADLLNSSNDLTFCGHSDTEVLLAAIEEFGLESALKRCVGMFAIALWDSKEKSLSLARDRFGEKPLYYGWQGGQFLFGSELKSFFAYESWNGKVNRDAVTALMRHGYVPDPHSIFDGIYKLAAGCVLTISLDSLREPASFDPFGKSNPGSPYSAPKFYWNPVEVAETARHSASSGSDSEAIDQLERLMAETISGQMVADTPLGAFLSGGVDSSLIVALMQRQASSPVKTFTIGFNEDAFNEANFSKAVASHLGTDHTEFYVSVDEAKSVVPMLPNMYDEPFADSSQIPTYLLSKLTRQRVVVSLSGDGADELFGGYERYRVASKGWDRLSRFPASPRMLAARMVGQMSPAALNTLLVAPKLAFPNRMRKYNAAHLRHLAAIGTSESPESFYEALTSSWSDPTSLILRSKELSTFVNNPSRCAQLDDFYSRMMFLDSISYLPGDILTKVDRASMAVGLESRAPFLDHRIAEFAWSLPTSMRIRGSTGKWILKQLLYRHVPKELIDRPKAGFRVPLGTWLRGGLRDWSESLLNQKELENEGLFDSTLVMKTWKDHLSGKINNQHLLWPILMYRGWNESLK